VQALIEQLGDRDFRVREEAEKKLIAQGMPALPLLRKAMGHGDPEIRRRVMRLVPGLEHAALVAPKRITMTVKGLTLNTVLQRLSKESGYNINHMGGAPPMVVRGGLLGGLIPGLGGGPAPPKEPTFSYNFVNEPFWDVLDRICQDANLTLQQGYGDEVIRLYQGSYSPFTGRDGAFRYTAMNMQMYRNIELSAFNPKAGAASARSESLTFNIALFSEPRLPFLGIGEIRLDVAYDSERNSMIPKNVNDPNGEMMGGPWGGGFRMGRRYYGGGYKQMSIQSGFQIERISEKASTIKLIKGVAPVTLLVEQKPVMLTDDIMKAKGKKTTVGELEFNIESVTKKPNDQYEVKFSVTNKGNINDYTWQNTLYQRLELQDAKGAKYQQWGSSWHGGGGNTASLTMTYNGAVGAQKKPGPPTKFVYQHWVTKQHDVYFEFKDVPLP
jgi:hypothetical protein